MKALESPQMVSAFHDGGTLEIARTNGQQGTNFNVGNSTDQAVTLHPPASAFSVMAGSVIPAVLVSGINSDLPGPILAQVSQNVFDSATGKYLLVPQGSRLIGIYQNASTYGQQRVEIAWQRLIFPNTSSMDLPQMPGADQGGYSGFTDEVNNHYMRTFGTAAVMSLISAGQMVGQMATFGGGGTYGPYGYSQPNQWAMASQTAGSAASGQFGSVGQQMIGQGMNRPPTIEIRPGYQFNVMVTEISCFRRPTKAERTQIYTERMRDCARNVHKTDSRRRAMGVLKRKEEPTETITLRVPASVKAEIDRLRERTIRRVSI